MRTDAIFGLVVGVILVIAVAIMFYTNEPAIPSSAEAPAKTTEAKTPSAAAMLPPPATISRPGKQPAPAKVTSFGNQE
jgi:hypothetical protein